MAKRKKPFIDDRYQSVVLIAFLINEMAMADGYESLQEAATIDPDSIDLYARYSHAALGGFEKCRQLSVGTEQTAEANIFFMSDAIASADGVVPVKDKHIRYAKAAQIALQTYQDCSKKQAADHE